MSSSDSTSTARALRTGGEILADALIALGANTAYCVPGESYLAFLDAAHDRADRLRLITCRQEGGAAYMADAHGKLTGEPGILFVTRGPGACNATVGVHTAMQDGTPMLLFVGQVDRGMLGREAFQEVDMAAFFKPLAKFTATADTAERLPELVARAWAAATSGRPGPAVIALPEDMLTETATVADPRPFAQPEPAPQAADMERLQEMLEAAERPLLIVGGSTWTPNAARAITAWAEAAGLPTIASFRRQDVVHNDSPVYLGELGYSASPAINARVKAADLILLVGDRMSEVPNQGYTLIESPQPKQTLIHVFPDPEEIGRVFRPDLGIVSAMAPFCALLPSIDGGERWADWLAEGRAERAENLIPPPCSGPVDMGEIMSEIAKRLPEDAILANGAGNYTGWSQRFLPYRTFPSQLAPGNGSMGYGVPAAIAACVAAPGRRVIGFAGDGCFLMNGQELATAMAHGLAPILIVIDNGMYGTIRMHQEREYPDRVIATDLHNPDFTALAKAHGALAWTIEKTEDFVPAFEAALEATTASLIHIKLDPEVLTHRGTLSGLRAKARAAKAAS
ncbi:thiamine pyrophosphate-binding protein [Rhodospirillum sp. A1_3_36]|uniref:thiamine pyrophosphate-binding protein n=1 Tax=Rhodospirillum sp. A1_3_36 TaxID=3391666 RepID=UPI0039A602B7